MMKQVEGSMRSGRYRNIARRRKVILDGIKGTKSMVSGQMHINRDRSVALPNYLQDEIVDAMGEATPKGYEDLLKGYYQRLAETK